MNTLGLVEHIALASGCLGLIGSFLVIITYQCSTYARRLTTILSISDMLQGIFFVLNGLSKNHLNLCSFLTPFGIFAATSSFFWTSCIAFYVWYVIYYSTPTLPAKYTAMFHILAWGYPSVFLIVALITDPTILTHADGLPDVPWCFISKTHPNWEFFAIHFPLFLCWIVTTTFYLRARHQIYLFEQRYSSSKRRSSGLSKAQEREEEREGNLPRVPEEPPDMPGSEWSVKGSQNSQQPVGTRDDLGDSRTTKFTISALTSKSSQTRKEMLKEFQESAEGVDSIATGRGKSGGDNYNKAPSEPQRPWGAGWRVPIGTGAPLPVGIESRRPERAPERGERGPAKSEYKRQGPTWNREWKGWDDVPELDKWAPDRNFGQDPSLDYSTMMELKRMKEVQSKLIFIPLVFIILRLPGAIYRILGFVGNQDKANWLLYLIALGDPAQGLATCIFFVLMRKQFRKKLLFNRRCCGRKQLIKTSVNNEPQDIITERDSSGSFADISSDPLLRSYPPVE